MNRFFVLSYATSLLLLTGDALAQTGFDQMAASDGSGPAKSGSVESGMGAVRLGLDGYCAVCQVNMKQWMPGSPQHQTIFDGVVYRFPGADQLAMFQANPTKFAPALGGDDVVVYARTGKRSPGKTAYGARYLDRLYFFSTEANKDAFRANPARYVNADLALSGACAVCRVDMNQPMAGDSRFVSTHRGLRYLFAGPQQKQAFDANPGRYVVVAPNRATMPSESGAH